KPIFRADRETHVFQQVVDLLVCKVLWLDLARVFIFVEPALLEVGKAVPKPAAEVDEIHLAPQIDVLIWRGRPCQVDPTTDARADRRERLAALRAIAKAKAFEPRGLVDDDDLEGPCLHVLELIEQPLYVLEVDGVHISVSA